MYATTAFTRGTAGLCRIVLIKTLVKEKTNTKFIVVRTDGYSKLMWAIPNGKTTATNVARIFVEDWVVPYGTSNWLLTENGPQFAEKVFNAVCVGLDTEPPTTTSYHLQTNGQTEQYNRIICS